MTAKRAWAVAVVAVVGVLAMRTRCHHGEAARHRRIVSFNIEHFPKDQRQVDGAFDELVAIRPDIVGAQEITDPVRFVEAARLRLGEDWDFVHDERRVANHHHIGVLFDRAHWRFVAQATHESTRLGPLDLPILEVTLASEDDDRELTVYVVHLRPLTAGRSTRILQHAAIAEVMQQRRGEAVLLGDFNATEPGDREDLTALAATAGLHWASEALACTAFWNRPDGCPRSRLDHVLTTSTATDVTVGGGCARDGCEREDRCPIYEAEVSDHCPVVVDF